MTLFTLAEFKAHERITDTSSDAVITMLAGSVSAAVDKYLRRTVEASLTDQVEYYDGSGTSTLLLRQPPIISVTSVHVDASRAWEPSTAVPASGFAVYRDSGILEMLPDSGIGALFGEGGVWPKGSQNIRVIYRGGWAAADIPLDIKQAAILWAAAMFRRPGGRSSGDVISHSIGSFSESFGGVATYWIPDGPRRMLAPYRLPPNLAGVSR